jgi:flagellar motility protein MotE (MotC chaperone)
MKPAVKYAVMGGGALVLLFGSFATFAALSGQPLHKVAILKYFVSAPLDPKAGGDAPDEHTAAGETHAPEGEHPATAEAPKTDGAEEQKAVEKTISVLGAFTLPSGFSTDELVDMQGELRKSAQETKALLTRLKQRERDLVDRENDIDQRVKDLAAFQKRLTAWNLELEMQKAENDRDASARAELDNASWKQLAKFFEEGDPADMVKKLLSFPPREAAKILRALDDERSGSILNALPADKYADYIQEYRAQTIKDGAKKKP